MNAAVLVDGYAKAGPEGARAALADFWQRVSRAALLSPFRRTPLDVLLGRWTLDYSPMFVAMDMMSRVFSPYNLGKHAANPLSGILAECVDFDRLSRAPIKLFVTATNVRTGRGRVFRNAEITPDVLLASACLPTLFQAVEIDGEVYWDGGYSGNPTMAPLVNELVSDDTILIPINPVERPGTPKSAHDILNRLNEVSFNAVLIKELKMMALLRRVADIGTGEGAQWARMRVHMVRNHVMDKLGASSKLNAEWEFVSMLRDEGRTAAEEFLVEHAGNIGKQSTLDIDRLLTEMQ
jgi:NTE family protein